LGADQPVLCRLVLTKLIIQYQDGERFIKSNYENLPDFMRMLEKIIIHETKCNIPATRLDNFY